ncbi:MAG TPA: sensor domain-containing diguanylate cyclase [Candidatus Dormibacteraeota bacterium]|nr:sensor domain-containing diguanylate cyclase [Candidatus Dormibacteraeota bacterium]
MISASEVLGALASGLAADSTESGKKAIEVLRTRSPELFTLSEQTGEDLVATSASFIDVLLSSLRGEQNLPWDEYDQRARDHGRLRAAQGVPLESLIDVLAVYRRATIELLIQPLAGKPNSDEVLALAQSRLESVIDRLTSSMARGYLDHLDEEHRIRENELYGLAAIAAVMGRSLDMNDTAEVALAETLAAFSLDAGAIWLRERAAHRLVHTIGLEADEVEDYIALLGPDVKAAVSAVGRSESRVDGVIANDGWNGIRAQLRTGGRAIGMMSVATRRDRIFNASEMLMLAAVADQIAIALDRARQFSNEARTDHLTGLANRREFERVIEREVALAERHDRQITVMMIDVDNLKKINDRHGHGAGDSALRLVAQELQRVMRASDLCGRIGGDEFAVAMPETDLHRAREVARRLRSSIQAMNLGARSTHSVEVSIGLGAWRRGMDWQALVQVADTALYEDKRHRKEVKRWSSGSSAERKSPSIRLAGGTGKRRLAGG